MLDPAIDRHGIRPSDKRFEIIDGDGKTEVGGTRVFQRQDAAGATLQVDKRSAAVARLERNGELNHRAAVDFAPA